MPKSGKIDKINIRPNLAKSTFSEKLTKIDQMQKSTNSKKLRNDEIDKLDRNRQK